MKMAWRTVEYSCGHSQELQFYGPGRERDAKQEWMERGICPDCYRAQKEDERRQENERAASIAGTIGFAALTGSDKQIAWAATIRQKSLEKLLTQNGIRDKIVGVFNAETSAKWWIDHRGMTPYSILETITKIYGKEI
jgi:hypothetical protein